MRTDGGRDGGQCLIVVSDPGDQCIFTVPFEYAVFVKR
jgi:hypothetical protein